MSPLPTADWTVTLDRMTAALERTIADLDRYCSEWSAVTDFPATTTPPDHMLMGLEQRLDQWNARLTAATELAASVEKELGDREAAIGQWREVFDSWREFIECRAN